jgi:hypothetical protein
MSRCRALSHGEMVPAVQDFCQQQEQLEGTPTASDDASGGEEGRGRFTFKGEALISPQQLREQLKVSILGIPQLWLACMSWVVP